MGEIKSAFERAMERVEKLEKPSEEEVLKWKYLPEGQKLAADYLREGGSLVAELGKHEEKAKRFVIKGAEEILLRNISLPINDVVRKNNKRAMDGIKAIKTDKGAIENVYSKMRRIFAHYENEGEQQRRQAYEGLRQDFQAGIEQAMRQQGNLPSGARVEAESHPQFREEWRNVLAQLDSQYLKLLDEYKQEIARIR
ncbi:MAG: hypothetical protein FJ012_07280 [Chloroflexi bacterium]|nr:hypothetical protein [Chloroflexota bacterium]